ncbi:MAG: o-succinylbenzoate synthase [Ardenticatenaceae bacterium]
MKIERIELHHITLPLVHPFQTSFGIERVRPCILVAVHSAGLVGWAECTAGDGPWYSYETVETAWHVLRDFLIPSLVGRDVATVGEAIEGFKGVRGHPMAKTALENAVWDLLAKADGKSLCEVLGGVRERVEVGVSIGIQPTLEGLLARVDDFVAQGYRRIKVKIKPGWELTPLRALRERHPDVSMMADANSAFRLEDAALFREMDGLDLLMIEQPLGYDDIADHAKLQAQIKTPLCLDESIHSPDHARWALELKACGIINMKVARVGGLTNALAIHEMCQEAGVPVWCGGMLETGVGRATNLHLATLPNFTLPGDLSATSRYYHEDIAEPTFSLNVEDSTITVPMGLGIGVEVQMERLERAREGHLVLT